MLSDLSGYCNLHPLIQIMGLKVIKTLVFAWYCNVLYLHGAPGLHLNFVSSLFENEHKLPCLGLCSAFMLVGYY